MSDRAKANSAQPIEESPGLGGEAGLGAGPAPEELWPDKYIDLDARNLIDMQVAMTDPASRRVRGIVFSASDRSKVKTAMRKIIEERLVPFIRQRIKLTEESVGKTRKGSINFFKNFVKKAERSETEGTKDNFKMNRTELELRNLSDLSFVF